MAHCPIKPGFLDCCYHCCLQDVHQIMDGFILDEICSFLFPTELKSLGDAGSMTRTSLTNACDDVKWRLQNIVRWCRAAGDAQVCKRDDSVAFSFGGLYPGGLALACLRVTSDCDVSFR